MGTAKDLKMLNRLGMRLAGCGQHRAALSVLALALRQALHCRAVLQEAKIRNNLALVLTMAGKPHLARRQLIRAMGLVAARVGIHNRFYRLLRANLIKTLRDKGHLQEMAA